MFFCKTSTGHHTDEDTNSQKPDHNVRKSIEYWLKERNGIRMDSKKLVLGLASYGRTWNLPDACNNWQIGTSVPSQGGIGGPLTNSAGFLAYYEICNKNWQNHICTSSAGNTVNAPYGSDGKSFIGYDDEESIQYKVRITVSLLHFLEPNSMDIT